MNIYVAFCVMIALLIGAGICVFKAYRRGLADGLDISNNRKLKETVEIKKKEAQGVAQVDDDTRNTQLQKLLNF